MGKPRVFVSHSHKDRDFVEKLIDRLESAGYRVWYDRWIPLGQLWKPYLRREIRRSEVFLFIVTPNSVDSLWCQWELYYAARSGCLIIPIWLEPTPSPPIELEEIQGVDCQKIAKPTACIEEILRAFEEAFSVGLEISRPISDPSERPIWGDGNKILERFEGGEPLVKDRISEQLGLIAIIALVVIFAIFAAAEGQSNTSSSNKASSNSPSDTYTPTVTPTPTDPPEVLPPATWDATQGVMLPSAANTLLPSPIPSSTPTPTPTSSATMTPTPTPTSSATPSATSSATPLPSATLSPISTATATFSPTTSPTQTPFPSSVDSSHFVDPVIGCVVAPEGVGVRTQPLLTPAPFGKLNPGDCEDVLWEMTNKQGNSWLYFPNWSPGEGYYGGWGYFRRGAMALTPAAGAPEIIHDGIIEPSLVLCEVMGQGYSVDFRVAPHPTTFRYRLLRPPYGVIPIVRVIVGADGKIWYFGVLEEADWLFGWIPAEQVTPLGQCPPPQ